MTENVPATEEKEEEVDYDKLLLPPPFTIITEGVNQQNSLYPGNLKLDQHGELLKTYISFAGFTSYLLDSYNNVVNDRIPRQILSYMIQLPTGMVRFENIQISRPTYVNNHVTMPLTPWVARTRSLNYCIDYYVDIVNKLNNGMEERRSKFHIATIPLMVGSFYCWLYNRTPEELLALGENPYDPWGYFILGGTERIILLQEKLCLNRFFQFVKTSKGDVICLMTCQTLKGTEVPQARIGKRKGIKLSLYSMTKNKKGRTHSIGIFQIFRMLGVVDQESIKTYIAAFTPPEQLRKVLIMLIPSFSRLTTVSDDYRQLAQKMGLSVTTTREQLRETMGTMFNKELFPQLNEEQDSSTKKLFMLTIMIVRMAQFLAGYRKLDERDSWSNKRIDDAGKMCENLFRGLWRKMIRLVENDVHEGKIRDFTSMMNNMKANIITTEFNRSFTSTNWGITNAYQKANVVTPPGRDSIAKLFSELTRIDVGVSRNDREAGLRMVQITQWGLICPVETPEGQNCGISKHMGVTTFISIDRPEFFIRQFVDQHIVGAPSPEKNNPFIINGKCLGWCAGQQLRKDVLKFRRNLTFHQDIGVILDSDGYLHIYTDAGRVIRPVLVVGENGKLEIDNKNLWGSDWNTLLSNGCVEYVGAFEQEFLFIASTIIDVRGGKEEIEQARKAVIDAEQIYQLVINNGEFIVNAKDEEGFEIQKKISDEEALTEFNRAKEILKKAIFSYSFTHCEIDPQDILGVSASITPAPQHNQGPRLTFQASMGKHALGIYHPRHMGRFDGKMKVLSYPNRPLFEAQVNEWIGLGQMPASENVTAAFCTYHGYGQEDSFIFCKDSIDNGLFRYFKYVSYKIVVKAPKNNYMEIMKRPQPKPFEPQDRYANIDQNGRPMIGSYFRQEQCIFGKVRKDVVTGEEINISEYVELGEEGWLDRIEESVNEDKEMVIKAKLRVMREPRIGDKFAPRNAQKGTIGLIVHKEDMPWTISGITPDIIVNPHCVTGDTLITLSNGISRPIKQMNENGGDHVWSWNKRSHVIEIKKQIAMEPRGIGETLEVKLIDGRTIRCTPEHKFWIINYNSYQIKDFYQLVEAEKLCHRTNSNDCEVICGIEGCIDDPTSEELKSELECYLATSNSLDSRDKVLALARLVGCLFDEISFDEVHAKIEISDPLAADHFIGDLSTIDDEVEYKYRYIHGEPKWIVTLPEWLLDCMENLGSRRTSGWPTFLFNNCPRTIIREFLAGLFGRGEDNNITINPQKKVFNDFQYSVIDDIVEVAEKKISDLAILVSKVGIENSLVIKNGPRVSILIPTVPLCKYIGFRYNLDKSFRLSLAACYWRMSDYQWHKSNYQNRFINVYEFLRIIHREDIIERKSLESERKFINKARCQFYSLTIADITRTGKKEPVYDLSVFDNESFIANGMAISNSLPSRMTIEWFIEIMMSKVAALKGERINATAFRNFSLENARKILHSYGFHSLGYERMYSGTTGRMIHGLIFTGPCAFQALRHQVGEKLQVRQRGSIKPTTHQPTAGRKQRGGLRFGEMERDGFLSHGASGFGLDRLLYASDIYREVYCQVCGTAAVSNNLIKENICTNCGTQGVFGVVSHPYAIKYLFHLLYGMMFKITYNLKTEEERLAEGKIYSKRKEARDREAAEELATDLTKEPGEDTQEQIEIIDKELAITHEGEGEEGEGLFNEDLGDEDENVDPVEQVISEYYHREDE